VNVHVCVSECVCVCVCESECVCVYSTKPAPSYIAGSTLEDVPPNLPNLYVAGVCVCVSVCVCVCVRVYVSA